MRVTSRTEPGPVQAARNIERRAPLTRRCRTRTINRNGPNPGGRSRPIGQSFAQDVSLRQDIARAQRAGGRDFRVNQQQVNASGRRVGINRPDLQYTNRFGVRVYVEYERRTHRGIIRGRAHARRIRANDPFAIIKIRYVG